MNHRRKARAQLMLILACAFGCTVASLSGTLAAMGAVEAAAPASQD